ncbi:MAG: hypothetical protein WBR29_02680 [Gammaproteobacteria bacterium]
MPSLEELITRAEYHLHALDLASGECEFTQIDKAALRNSTFMDHRLRVATQEPIRTSLELIEKHLVSMPTAANSRSINYIFHTAFCCSTLISRCLDIQDVCSALREPAVFMQMANYKRVGNPYFLDMQRQQVLLNTVLYLLAKSSAQGAITLIKPTNAANNLIAEVVQNKYTHGALLLYSSLEQFLISIIKKGEEGRAFARRLLNVIRMDSERSNSMTLDSLSQLTDLQIVAFVWYLQLDAYLKVLDGYPSANVRTLDCEVFLADPLNTLKKLCELFGVKVKLQVLEEIVTGPMFRKYSKNGLQDYDASIREAENARIAAQYHDTIKGIIAWSERIRPEGPVLLPLPRAL